MLISENNKTNMHSGTFYVYANLALVCYKITSNHLIIIVQFNVYYSPERQYIYLVLQNIEVDLQIYIANLVFGGHI